MFETIIYFGQNLEAKTFSSHHLSAKNYDKKLKTRLITMRSQPDCFEVVLLLLLLFLLLLRMMLW